MIALFSALTALNLQQPTLRREKRKRDEKAGIKRNFQHAGRGEKATWFEKERAAFPKQLEDIVLFDALDTETVCTEC